LWGRLVEVVESRFQAGFYQVEADLVRQVDDMNLPMEPDALGDGVCLSYAGFAKED